MEEPKKANTALFWKGKKRLLVGHLPVWTTATLLMPVIGKCCHSFWRLMLALGNIFWVFSWHWTFLEKSQEGKEPAIESESGEELKSCG